MERIVATNGNYRATFKLQRKEKHEKMTTHRQSDEWSFDGMLKWLIHDHDG